jgi:hypothetical protein
MQNVPFPAGLELSYTLSRMAQAAISRCGVRFWMVLLRSDIGSGGRSESALAVYPGNAPANQYGTT